MAAPMAAPMAWITIEGNIGAGKSTLIAALDRQLASAGPIRAVLPEPVGDWTAPVLPDGRSMLQAFYDGDPYRHGLAFQMYVLLSRARQALAVGKGDHGSVSGIVVAERCVASGVEVFGRAMREAGHMDDMQWTVLQAWAEQLAHLGMAPPPSAVVYLRCTPEVCLERIRQRGRPQEAGLDIAVVRGLHAAHEAWVDGLRASGTPVLVLDASAGADSVESAAAAVAMAVSAGEFSHLAQGQ